MEKTEIEQIAGFIEETTKLLVEWGFDGDSMQPELARLHKIIGWLLGAKLQAKDPANKALLEDLETRARKCRDHIVWRSLMPHQGQDTTDNRPRH